MGNARAIVDSNVLARVFWKPPCKGHCDVFEELEGPFQKIPYLVNERIRDYVEKGCVWSSHPVSRIQVHEEGVWRTVPI